MNVITARGDAAIHHIIDRAFRPDIRLEEYRDGSVVRLRAVQGISAARCRTYLGIAEGLTDDDYEVLLDLELCVQRKDLEGER